MKLQELLQGIHVLEMTADAGLEIREIAYDSRKVTKGCLFAAVSGLTFDGNRFIPMALERGAAVVLTARRPKQDIPYVLVENDRRALAVLGANFYGHPAEAMTVIGVTGTNGKTTTTQLLKQVLERVQGAKVGLIGTVENMIGAEALPSSRTTPESLEVQGLLAKMRDAGCRYAVMEVSSHALALERVYGIFFDVAAFTNLTEDHLDFHKTMEGYCEAKAKLFSCCGTAVINADDCYAERVTAQAVCPILTTSTKGRGMVCAEHLKLQAERVSFDAVSKNETAAVSVAIPGRFTVYNVLTVMGIAKALGISLKESAGALKTASGVRGRVEVVPTPGREFSVLIDYAHTPDGLENVLSTVKDFCKGRLIAVFGCGGDRDPIKRPIMGKIGVKLADFAVITSDNPRTEDPDAIIADILKGVKGQGKKYIVEPDRKKAIRYAMDIAKKDDIIVLAGKGHETDQEINGVKHHLDEREEVAAHLIEMR